MKSITLDPKTFSKNYASFRFGPFFLVKNLFCLFPFRPLSVSAPYCFGPLLIWPLSVCGVLFYAIFRFGEYLILPNSFMPLSFMPLSVLAPFRLAPFRFGPFPFRPHSVYASFRIDGNCWLCQIPLCFFPASLKNETGGIWLWPSSEKKKSIKGAASKIYMLAITRHL
jgi:hypothetical protein